MTAVHSCAVSRRTKRNMVKAESGIMRSAAILMPAGSPNIPTQARPEMNGTMHSPKLAIELPCMKLLLHHGIPSLALMLETSS